MADSNFDRAVVFVIDHNEAGAVGLVLNDPRDDYLGQAIPIWDESRFADCHYSLAGLLILLHLWHWVSLEVAKMTTNHYCLQILV